MKPIVLQSQPWGWSHGIEDRFAPLVARLEAYAAARPLAYRRRVLAGALLGYAFLALVLAMLLGGIGLIIALMVSSGRVNGGEIKLIILLAVPTYLVLRALWIRLEPPVGQAVDAESAPDLFALIERVRQSCNGPPLQQVLVTDDFNAAIVQHPRFGIFGGYRNYLLIGLPLMQALDSDAFAAVVGHEFGHLVNADGKTGSYVYRVRATWARLSENLGDSGTGALLRRFFSWYGPWFNAYSFVLARHTEYAADRVSAAVTSPEIAARALSSVMVESHRYSSDHWRSVFAQVDRHDIPEALPFASARRFFADPAADRSKPLTLSLAEDTGLADTHPALVDRLAVLGQPPVLPAPCAVSAAEALFPDGGAALAAAFDADWWAYNAENWAADRANVQAERERLAGLAARAATLQGAEKWDHAWLTERHVGPAAAMGLYEALIDNPGEPDDVPAARLAVGRLRLDAGDPSGLTLLEALVAEDTAPGLKIVAANVALDYLARHPEAADLTARDHWRSLLGAEQRREAAVQAELNRIDGSAELASRPLPPEMTDAITAIAAADRRIRRVWICQRRLTQAPNVEQYLLLFETGGWFASEDYAQFLDDVLAVLTRYGPALAIRTAAHWRWAQKRVAKLENTLVYKR